MKKYISILLLLTSIIVNAQIFTQGPSNGSVIITPSGVKGQTNSASTISNVALGNSALAVNTSGSLNVAIGEKALSTNTTGYSNTAVGYQTLLINEGGYSNTAVGTSALANNSSGTNNTAIGDVALKSNTTGTYNTATGERALYTNSSGYFNTAHGSASLYSNSAGLSNTAIGTFTLYTNLGGSYNTGLGERALFLNTGSNNMASGYYALYNNSSGFSNTALGYKAGNVNTTGSNNTFLGFQSDASVVNLSNATAIGNGAIVNASNKIRIGNASVTVVEGPVAYTFPSDRRLKENITYTNRLGLDFINRLQTVSYTLVADKTKVRYDGFIAQDIEQIIKETGIEFSGLKKSDDGMYSLAYSDFIMPLVNSVKELKQQNDRLEKQNAAILKQVEELKALVLQTHNSK